MRVIVTGGMGLIGKEVVDRLIDDGHAVEGLDFLLGHDLTNEEFVKTFFSKVKADVLIVCHASDDKMVNNRDVPSFIDVPLDKIANSFNTNVISVLSVCREFIRNNKTGSIVLFSSIYGARSPRMEIYDSSPKFIGYGLCKSAIVNMTNYLAVHCAPEFRVNCIMPGGITAHEPKEFRDRYSSLVPMQRMMNVSEIYGLVKYLISESSSYVTGSVFRIDGGYLSC